MDNQSNNKNKSWEKFKKDNPEKLSKFNRILSNQTEDPGIKEAAEIIEEYGSSSETTNSPESRTNKPFFTLDELFGRDFPDVGWVISPLIPSQGLVALSGAPGNYKSWITQQIAICVATGTPLFDNFETTQGSVLIIDKENNLRLVKERLVSLGAQSKLNIFFYDLEFVDFLTDNQDCIEIVCDIVRENNIKLVIIDSLIRSHKQDENSASGMSQVFGALRKIQDAGAAILFTHHHRKQSLFNRSGSAENLRGSSDILAAVDCHLAVDKLEDGIKVTQSKLRQRQSIKPFKIRLDSLSEAGDEVKFTYLGEVEEDKVKKEDAKEVIALLLEEQSFKRQDLINQLVQDGICSKRTADTALSELVKDGKVIHTSTKPHIYSLSTGDVANRNTINSLQVATSSKQSDLNLEETDEA
jgi:hypothetical protein